MAGSRNTEALIAAGAALHKTLAASQAEVASLAARVAESDDIIVFLDKLLVDRGPSAIPPVAMPERLALLEKEVRDGRALRLQYEAMLAVCSWRHEKQTLLIIIVEE